MGSNKAIKGSKMGIVVLYMQRPEKVRNEPCTFLAEKYYRLRKQKVQRLTCRNVLGTCHPSFS